MAVKMVTTVKRFIGTAAERAAMSITDIPVGSSFFESDTGVIYVFNGAAWTKKIYPAS